MTETSIPGCTRPYLFHEFGIVVMAHPTSCFFCDHCTDIWYDFENGPYMFDCAKQGEDEDNGVRILRGLKGECPDFMEEGGEPAELPSPFRELSIIDTKGRTE